MKRLLSALSLSVGLPFIALAQASPLGVPVEPIGKVPPPNYSTKGLVFPPAAPSPGAPAGAISYTITFDDPGGTYASYYAGITSAIQQAGAEWNARLTGSGSLEVEVAFGSNPTVTGASLTSGFVRNDGVRDIFEQGAAFEIRTGMDPNGAAPDIRFTVGTNYLINTLWFDPNPQTRTAPIPAGKVDAISVMAHEFGHAFVFTGWKNGTTGVAPATFMSTFDNNVTFDGTNLFFSGPSASARYGGPVPLTYNNYGHLGNNSPRPGADLLTDMMNGVVYNLQTRYLISALDLDIVKDSGVGVVASTGAAARLVNISTRLRVEGGDVVPIAGFIVTGTQPKKVIVRALGPSLNVMGTPVAGRVADTTLELIGPGGTIALNDNWRTTQQAEVIASTVPPPHDLESAIVATLPASSGGLAYTAVVRGANGATGVGQVEVYDLDSTVDSQLANISTRGLVQTGDNVMIGGIILLGNAPRRVIVRAIGPSLNVSGMPLSGRLLDPTLEIRDANGVLEGTNDNWRSSQQAEIIATTVAPTNDLESAIVATLPASAGGTSHTAIVRGTNNTTGVGLVEAYILP